MTVDRGTPCKDNSAPEARATEANMSPHWPAGGVSVTVMVWQTLPTTTPPKVRSGAAIGLRREAAQQSDHRASKKVRRNSARAKATPSTKNAADAFLEGGQGRGRRCQQRACAHRGRDERQRADAKLMDPTRHRGLWRQGLREWRGGGGGDEQIERLPRLGYVSEPGGNWRICSSSGCPR